MAVIGKVESTYRECCRCILNTNDSKTISFDHKGLCINCRQFDKTWESLPKTKSERDLLLKTTIEKTKRDGKGKRYDCIIGVSGGVDSSYVAMLVKDMGLRPLAVHFDNGWNSELAVKNIEKMVSVLDIDLYTYVINWEDFKRLQLAYFRASVVDIEVLTDHAIYGAMYKLANDNDIKTIISGVNVATESVLPDGWIYNKFDSVNIKSIFRQFGQGGAVDSYPFLDKKAKRKIKNSGVEIVKILDIIDFNVASVKTEIKNRIGWVSYKGKHFESIFTRFYQGYMLPHKFGIDKRKAHLSNLICSGQMTREEALLEMKEVIYTPGQIADDMEFVLKKLGLSKEEFEKIMALPIRRHQEFDVEGAFFSEYPIFKPLRPMWGKLRRHAS